MLSESHVLTDLISDEHWRQLKVAAKRYWSTPSAKHVGPGSATLILAHGSGFRTCCMTIHISILDIEETDKEHFEPFLEHLFSLSEDDGSARIREAWALDWQSHGDSAVLNADVIKPDEIVSESDHALHHQISSSHLPGISIWGQALASFASSTRLQGPIIAIGHSAGSSALYDDILFIANDHSPTD